MSSRHKRRKSSPQMEVALGRVVVPMLDMSFQILFFFIITFNPNELEGQMTMNLPKSGQAKAQDPSNVDISKPSDTELDIPSDFVVVLRAYNSNEGNRLRSVTVTIRDSEKVTEVGTEKDLDAADLKATDVRSRVKKLMDKLQDELKKKYDAKKATDPMKATDNVKLEANGGAKQGVVIAAMDACLRAGYTQVGFAPPPDAE
jgi:biopolymer transport protein ExbD